METASPHMNFPPATRASMKPAYRGYSSRIHRSRMRFVTSSCVADPLNVSAFSSTQCPIFLGSIPTSKHTYHVDHISSANANASSIASARASSYNPTPARVASRPQYLKMASLCAIVRVVLPSSVISNTGSCPYGVVALRSPRRQSSKDTRASSKGIFPRRSARRDFSAGPSMLK